jgi:hypothetical protein
MPTHRITHKHTNMRAHAHTHTHTAGGGGGQRSLADDTICGHYEDILEDGINARHRLVHMQSHANHEAMIMRQITYGTPSRALC